MERGLNPILSKMMNIGELVNDIKNLKVYNLYPTKLFTDNIYPHIKDINLIGKGTLGNVYDIPNSSLVVKVTSPCNNDVNDIIGVKYCNSMKNKDQIEQIVHDKKILIMIANYLSVGQMAYHANG